MTKPKKIHLGVYGVFEYEGAILFIKKNRGPYAGMYDLPGGTIEFHETIDEALKREIKEETGADLKSASFLTNEEYQCSYFKDGEEKDFHHLGIYYVVDLTIGALKDGFDGHDSDGAIFISRNRISEEVIAPIAYQALKKRFQEEL